ncbi:hypothetical protein HPB50_019703 [Hyalomma asiaticum]|uniref:Uncharacterized protein n=1 Tax=Hyalomma asiaticum TaxID=266040 RepID=A0ACB7S866_HYAAI|nr:hypothetical protein HPB50_019703 [Hyalomma asiaticum]
MWRSSKHVVADAAARAAHSSASVTMATAAADFSRQRLWQLLLTIHTDKHVASNKPPPPLPENGLRGGTGGCYYACRLAVPG